MSTQNKSQIPVIYAQNELVNLKFAYGKCQLDILYYLLYVFRDGESVYSFKLSDISSVLGHSWQKSDVDRMGDALATAYFKYRQGDDDVEWYSLFRSLKYHKGVITVAINEDVLPFFQKTKSSYTKMELCSGLRLESKYAKRLYMLLCEYKYAGQHEFAIDDLKSTLQANSDSYGRFSCFKDMISLCMRQINELTDISVSVSEWRKTSRRITSVVFSIEGGSSVDDQSFDVPVEKASCINNFMAYGFDMEQAELLYANGLRLDYFRKVVGKVLEQLRRRKIVNANAYLAQCLTNEGYLRPREQRQVKTVIAEQMNRAHGENRQATIETIRVAVAAGAPVSAFGVMMRKYAISESDLKI